MMEVGQVFPIFPQTSMMVCLKDPPGFNLPLRIRAQQALKLNISSLSPLATVPRQKF